MNDFDWTTTQTSTSRILTIPLPRQWFRIPMIWEKLQGFRYLRCTLVLEIQVNSQPFNSGALVAWFNPLADQLAYQPSSTGHWGGIFGYPHVVYRCNENTAVQLRIPFFPVMSHFDLNTGVGTMGQVYLDVFSQLGGVSDADGTVWCWAEDIDTSMPTGLPNPMPTTVFEGEAHSVATEAPTQSAATGSPAVTEKVKAATNGTTETIFRVLAGISAGLSLAPPLAALGRMGAAVFSGVGAVAHFFGWSKPTDAAMSTVIEPRLGRFMANYDGDTKAKVLALDSRNATNIPVELFNSTEDEMAFSTMIKRYTWMSSFSFSASHKQGAIIFSWPVDPGSCLKASTTTEPFRIVREETYLSYLSTLAQFWRGGIKYKFMFMKTPFHSGRLRFVFVPGAVQGTDPTTIDFNKCYSEIHDLREKADVEFEVPYSYYQPWRMTEEGTPSTQANALGHLWRNPQGMLYVQVVNSLRAPATAASTVSCQIMTAGGADFQFAVPFAHPDVHVVSDKSQLPPLAYSGEAHSNLYPSDTTGLEVNAETIGEAFTGFRQWLKRFHPSTAAIQPYSQLPQTTPPLEADINRRENAFTRAIPLYRFQSGNLRMMCAKKTADPDGYRVTAFSGAPVYVPGATEAFLSAGIPIVENTFLEPVVEFEIPFYQPWVGIPTQTGNPSDLREGSVVSPDQYRNLPSNKGTFLGWVGADPAKNRIYLSTSENFSYGFLLGPPVTVTPLGASSG